MKAQRVARYSPAFAGGLLGIAAGAAFLLYGAYGWVMSFVSQPIHPPLESAAFVLAGAGEIIACFTALFRKRVGWAFALSLSGTGSVLLLFGAPMVRGALHLSWQLAFVPFLWLLAVTVLFALAADEYDPH